MIVTADEYNKNLSLLLNANAPVFAQLPEIENIYNIDAATREIDSPRYISVERDHKSETLYFAIDRYVGYMDLASTSCIITYRNEEANISRYYCVPFYDIYTFSKQKKMLVPWCIDAAVAAKAGTVHYSFQFFKITETKDGNGQDTAVLSYSLNTQQGESKIRQGMEVDVEDMNSDYLLKATQYEELKSNIDMLSEKVKGVYWTILD